MRGLAVVNPGILSLIQDLGRQGAAHLGLSPGGPADLHAFCWGNKLLGNCPNAAGIEITVGPASFSALADMTIAITGAPMLAKIDGTPQSNWHKFELKQGQRLSFDSATSGLRTYITVAGGLAAPKVFGSAATVCRNQLGGLATTGNVIGLGNKLQPGDVISLAHLPLSHPPHINHFVPRRYIPQYP
ncbi:MAG: urea amidolyase, partial [Gammaproteobacteria bacterium]|nr:urea amidolyase [Gammaproteobacteria bacterium]